LEMLHLTIRTAISVAAHMVFGRRQLEAQHRFRQLACQHARQLQAFFQLARQLQEFFLQLARQLQESYQLHQFLDQTVGLNAEHILLPLPVAGLNYGAALVNLLDAKEELIPMDRMVISAVAHMVFGGQIRRAC
jgi:hypothetical protein